MKSIGFILIVIITFSCSNKNEARFEITNNSNNIIDSVNIQSQDYGSTSKYIRIEPGETKVYLLNLSELPQIDGAYLLTFVRGENRKKESKVFGYFSGGSPLEELIKIKIEQDSIQFDFMLEK